ncbi:MAG: copper chaperone PCu(A)C [Ilumatobacteraceae bacterium]
MNPHPHGHSAARALVVSLAATFLLASCGDDAQTSSTNPAPATASIDVSGIWARTSPMVANAGALYLTIENTGGLDDTLVAASVDPSIAKTAELHETVAVDASESTMAGAMTASAPVSEAMPSQTAAAAGANAMMEMRPVDRIIVPAGGTVALAPGGYHIMLMDLVQPLAVGSTMDVTLSFETTGDKVVTASVRDTAP